MQRLTRNEREKIEYWRKCRVGVREISRLLHRDHAVVSRELRRNTGAGGRYEAARAQTAADRRGRITNTRKIEKDDRLRRYVTTRLKKDWSPEQIAGRLKEQPPPELNGMVVSHEAIYRYIYEGEGRFERLYPHLRRGQPKRRRQRARRPQNSMIPERISIHDRPTIIDSRGRFGDWESDTVQCRKQREALSVQCERRSKLTRISRVRDRSAKGTERALIGSVESLPPFLWKSVTFDNGGEGACHRTLRNDFGIDTYFCDAYAAWQKGGVENLNGLIRQYIPKDADLGRYSDDDIYRIQERLNDRPRKSLRFQTPNEVIAEVSG